LLSRPDFEAEGFGGLQMHRLAGGELDRHELAHAMVVKVLGRGQSRDHRS